MQQAKALLNYKEKIGGQVIASSEKETP